MKRFIGNLKDYKGYTHLIKLIRGLSGVVMALCLLTIPGVYIERDYFYDDYISGFFFGLMFMLCIVFLWVSRNKIKDVKMEYEEYLKTKEVKK